MSLDHATQQQKLQSSPWFSALETFFHRHWYLCSRTTCLSRLGPVSLFCMTPVPRAWFAHGCELRWKSLAIITINRIAIITINRAAIVTNNRIVVITMNRTAIITITRIAISHWPLNG